MSSSLDNKAEYFFLGLKIPFWLRVITIRFGSEGRSVVEAGANDYGKVGEEGG